MAQLREILSEYYRFCLWESPVLAVWPDLLFQQAANQPTSSAVAEQATARRLAGRWPDRPWLRLMNPPESAEAGPLVAMRAHAGEVSLIATSDDGRRLVTVAVDGTARIADLETGREIVRISDLAEAELYRFWRSAVIRVAAVGGDRLAVGLSTGEVVVFKVADGAVELRISPQWSEVRALLLATTGKRLAVAAREGDESRIRVFEIPSGVAVDSWSGGDLYSFSQDGRLVLHGGGIRDLDERAHKPVRLMDLGSVPPEVFDAEPGRFAFVARDGVLSPPPEKGPGEGTRIFRLAAGEVWDRPRGNLPTLSADGRWIVTFSESLIFAYETESGEEILALDNPHKWRPVGLWMAPAPSRLIVSGKHGELTIWDLRTGALVCDLADYPYPIRTMVVARDGRRAYFASWPHDDPMHGIRVFDFAGYASIGMLAAHTAQITALALTPDGRRLASGDSDGTVIVWDMATARVTPEAESMPKVVSALEFDGPDRVLFRIDAEMISLDGANVGNLAARISALESSLDVEKRLVERFGTEGQLKREDRLRVLALEDAVMLGFRSRDLATGLEQKISASALREPGGLSRTEDQHSSWFGSQEGRPWSEIGIEGHGFRVDCLADGRSVQFVDDQGMVLARFVFPERIARLATHGSRLAVGGRGRGRVLVLELLMGISELRGAGPAEEGRRPPLRLDPSENVKKEER